MTIYFEGGISPPLANFLPTPYQPTPCPPLAHPSPPLSLFRAHFSLFRVDIPKAVPGAFWKPTWKDHRRQRLDFSMLLLRPGSMLQRESLKIC